MTLDEFIDELNRPLYVYRMAKAITPTYAYTESESSALVKGAPKRMQKAQNEIESLIFRYARDEGMSWD